MPPDIYLPHRKVRVVRKWHGTTNANKKPWMTYFEVKLDTRNILVFNPEPIKTIYPN